MSAPTPTLLAHGASLFLAGQSGPAWRIVAGSVRLTRIGADGEHFAGIAGPGELIGSEALLDQPYRFNAYALGAASLSACQTLTRNALAQALAAAEQRAAEALDLRCGAAETRLVRLFNLLAHESEPGGQQRRRLAVPSLREMAEITDLTQETISRHVSRLRQLGQLVRHDRHRASISTRLLDTVTPSLALAA